RDRRVESGATTSDHDARRTRMHGGRGVRPPRRLRFEPARAAPSRPIEGAHRVGAQVRGRCAMSATAYVCRQFVEDVTAYLEGSLPDDIVVLVELHLADCPHCREYLAQMRRTIALTGSLATGDVDEMPDDLRQRLLRAFLQP